MKTISVAPTRMLEPGETRLLPSGHLDENDWLTLTVSALAPQRALELLEGLSADLRARAVRLSEEFAKLPAHLRQAQILAELGSSKDAAARLREVMGRLPARLQRALFQALPPGDQSHFVVLPTPEAAPETSSALLRYAQRLRAEATL